MKADPSGDIIRGASGGWLACASRLQSGKRRTGFPALPAKRVSGSHDQAAVDQDQVFENPGFGAGKQVVAGRQKAQRQ
jgi:hypothetical protein